MLKIAPLDIQAFLDKIGKDTTSSFDLLSWSKQLGIPKMRVIMKNELHTLSKHKRMGVKYIICNYQTSDSLGTHLVGLYRSDNQAFYFKSSGTQPFKEAIDFLGPNYIYSTFQIQDINQKCCGQLCLYFLYR